jgi:hypothetical protein
VQSVRADAAAEKRTVAVLPISPSVVAGSQRPKRPNEFAAGAALGLRLGLDELRSLRHQIVYFNIVRRRLAGVANVDFEQCSLADLDLWRSEFLN